MNADNEVLLDEMVDYFLDKIRNIYPKGPYITRVYQSKNKHTEEVENGPF